jgi:hypothetical protein
VNIRANRALIGQRVAAAVAQHAGVSKKPREKCAEGLADIGITRSDIDRIASQEA